VVYQNATLLKSISTLKMLRELLKKIDHLKERLVNAARFLCTTNEITE